MSTSGFINLVGFNFDRFCMAVKKNLTQCFYTANFKRPYLLPHAHRFENIARQGKQLSPTLPLAGALAYGTKNIAVPGKCFTIGHLQKQTHKSSINILCVCQNCYVHHIFILEKANKNCFVHFNMFQNIMTSRKKKIKRKTSKKVMIEIKNILFTRQYILYNKSIIQFKNEILKRFSLQLSLLFLFKKFKCSY